MDDSGVPDGITVSRGTHGLGITRRWSRLAAYVLFAWVAVWCGLGWFFLTLGGHSPGWGAGVLGVPAAGMAYAAFARLCNHTTLELDRAGLVVRHAPLPWPGGKRFATQEVKGFAAETRHVYAKSGVLDVCRIMVVLGDGRKKTLLSGLEMTPHQAQFIAAALAGQLGNVDRKEPASE